MADASLPPHMIMLQASPSKQRLVHDRSLKSSKPMSPSHSLDKLDSLLPGVSTPRSVTRSVSPFSCAGSRSVATARSVSPRDRGHYVAPGDAYNMSPDHLSFRTLDFSEINMNKCQTHREDTFRTNGKLGVGKLGLIASMEELRYRNNKGLKRVQFPCGCVRWMPREDVAMQTATSETRCAQTGMFMPTVDKGSQSFVPQADGAVQTLDLETMDAQTDTTSLIEMSDFTELVEELRCGACAALRSLGSGCQMPGSTAQIPLNDEALQHVLREHRQKTKAEFHARAVGDELVRRESWQKLKEAMTAEEAMIREENHRVANERLSKTLREWQAWLDDDSANSSTGERIAGNFGDLMLQLPSTSFPHVTRQALEAACRRVQALTTGLADAAGKIAILEEQALEEAGRQLPEEAEEICSESDFMDFVNLFVSEWEKSSAVTVLMSLGSALKLPHDDPGEKMNTLFQGWISAREEYADKFGAGGIVMLLAHLYTQEAKGADDLFGFSAGLPAPYKVMNSAVRLMSKSQEANNHWPKDKDEAAVPFSHWVKSIACLSAAALDLGKPSIVEDVKSIGNAAALQSLLEGPVHLPPEAFDQIEMTKGPCLFCGMGLDEGAFKWHAEKRAGDKFFFTALRSMSLCPSVAMNFTKGTHKVLIVLEGATVGLPVWHCSAFKTEMEVLLPGLSECKVLSNPMSITFRNREVTLLRLLYVGSGLSDSFLRALRKAEEHEDNWLHEKLRILQQEKEAANKRLLNEDLAFQSTECQTDFGVEPTAKKEEIEAVERALQESNVELKEARRKADEDESVIQRLRTEKETLHTKVTELAHVEHSFTAERETLTAERETLLTKVTELESKGDEVQTRMTELESLLQEAEVSKVRNEQETQALKQDIDKLNEQLSAKQSELEAMKSKKCCCVM